MPLYTADVGLDVSECDHEPIHVPGSIQPHGLLLIVTRDELRVVGGAGDLEQQFGQGWLGQDVAALLGGAARDALQTAIRPSCSLGVIGNTGWEGTGRHAGDCWLIELEPAEQRGSADVLSWIEDVGLSFERSGGLIELCERAAEWFRSLRNIERSLSAYRMMVDDRAPVVVATRQVA